MASNSRAVRREKDLEEQEKLGVAGLLLKSLTVQTEDWDTEELLDVIHWQRQVLAVACGIGWGVVPLTGFWAFAGFIIVNILVVLSWWRAQRIDEDEHGGLQALIAEGLPPAIGLFLIIWILVFTALGHEV